MDWKPTIGNVLQTLVIVGGLVAFLYSNAHQAQQDYGSMMVRQGTMDTRLTNIEQQVVDRNRLDEQFAADMRSSLERITEGVSDLRVKMAGLHK
jgi:hypothetical protein